MNKTIALQDIGVGDYQSVWDKQQELFDGIVSIKNENRTNNTKKETPNYLIYVEHPHVYTLGKSGDTHNMLLSEQMLKQVNATMVKIDRGGDITYHGPGQLVGYPIIDLDNFDLDIRSYIHNLEEAIIQFIAEYGLKGERTESAIGVWLDPDTPRMRKIAAIGVRTSRWVTMHGFAFNVNTDLKYFDYINPCGFTDKGATSLEKEIGKKFDMEEVKHKMNHHLSSVLKAEIIVPTTA